MSVPPAATPKAAGAKSDPKKKPKKNGSVDSRLSKENEKKEAVPYAIKDVNGAKNDVEKPIVVHVDFVDKLDDKETSDTGPLQGKPGTKGGARETKKEPHPTVFEADAGEGFMDVNTAEMLLLVLPVMALTLVTLFCFSAFTTAGFAVYGILVKAGIGVVGGVTITGGGLAALGVCIYIGFHAAEWYSWRPTPLMIGVLVLFYIFIGAAFCMTRVVPVSPIIICCVHYPLVMGKVMVLKNQKLCPVQFYKVLAVLFWKLSWAMSIIFLVWMMCASKEWNDKTADHLRDELFKVGVHKEYDLAGPKVCAALVNITDVESLTADEEVKLEIQRDSCSKISQMAWMIWANPGIVSFVMMGLAKFCSLRAWVLASGDFGHVAKVVCAVGGFVCIGLWMAAGQAGGDMKLANAFMLLLGSFAVSFAVWMAVTFDYHSVVEAAKESPAAKSVLPVFQSDMFKGVMVCMTLELVFAFLLFEVIARQLQKPCGIKGESKWISSRGLRIWNKICAMHWVILLEWGVKMSIACMVFKVFSVGTPVILACLNDFLASHEIYVVCIIFYFVGLVMFLLPPVPGVPVYLAAGSIVVEQMKKMTGFVLAVFLATCLCLVLKLSAVVGQQKGFGEGLGKSLSIQMAVGVHKPTIRAIENILKRPGITVEKVCILCGGPDWPTSVLTGILGLSCPQMLLGTCPVFFLIIPCVLCGGAFTEKAVKPYGPLILMAATATQGAMGFAAMSFIAKEQEASFEELSKPLPEHEPIIKMEKEAVQAAQRYRSATEWHKLGFIHKALILTTLAIVQPIALAAQCNGKLFFRTFALENRISDSFANYGLEGKPMNIFKPPGFGLLGAMVLGGIIFIVYGCVVKSTLVKKEPERVQRKSLDTE